MIARSCEGLSHKRCEKQSIYDFGNHAEFDHRQVFDTNNEVLDSIIDMVAIRLSTCMNDDDDDDDDDGGDGGGYSFPINPIPWVILVLDCDQPCADGVVAAKMRSMSDYRDRQRGRLSTCARNMCTHEHKKTKFWETILGGS